MAGIVVAALITEAVALGEEVEVVVDTEEIMVVITIRCLLLAINHSKLRSVSTTTINCIV